MTRSSFSSVMRVALLASNPYRDLPGLVLLRQPTAGPTGPWPLPFGAPWPIPAPSCFGGVAREPWSISTWRAPAGGDRPGLGHAALSVFPLAGPSTAGASNPCLGRQPLLVRGRGRPGYLASPSGPHADLVWTHRAGPRRRLRPEARPLRFRLHAQARCRVVSHASRSQFHEG